MHLIHSNANSRTWSASFTSLFIVKSFFLALSKSSSPISFHLTRLLMENKSPSKGQSLCFVGTHRKLNTNNLLQLRRPYKSLSPWWCILCKGDGESVDHLFLHCSFTIGLWQKLFNLTYMMWVPTRSIEEMLIIVFQGLGNSIIDKSLWKIACLSLV